MAHRRIRHLIREGIDSQLSCPWPRPAGWRQHQARPLSLVRVLNLPAEAKRVVDGPCPGGRFFGLDDAEALGERVYALSWGDEWDGYPLPLNDLPYAQVRLGADEALRQATVWARDIHAPEVRWHPVRSVAQLESWVRGVEAAPVGTSHGVDMWGDPWSSPVPTVMLELYLVPTPGTTPTWDK